MTSQMTHVAQGAGNTTAEWTVTVGSMPPASSPLPAKLAVQHIFPGVPIASRHARHWVGTVLSAALATFYLQISEVCELLVAELVANALMHSASGDPGATFTALVEVAASSTDYDVTIHLHDRGPTQRTDNHLRDADDGHGHGLNLIAELAHSNGRRSASECAAGPADVDRPADGDNETPDHCVWINFSIPFADTVEARDDDA